MNKTTKILIWLIVVIVVIAGIWWGVSRKSTQLPTTKKEVIKIGAILPLSGSAAFAGEQIRDGMLIAIDEMNKIGGINGKQVELLVEDSKTNPQEAITDFNNLLLKNPNVIISSLSSISMALVPLAKEKKIVLLATVATAPDLAKNKWSFRYYSTAEQEIPPIVKLASNFKIAKIGVLYLNDDFGLSMYSTLKNKFSGEVFGENFLISQTDFKTELTKIKAKNPDAVLVVGFRSHIINAIKQIKELNIKAVIFAPSTIAFPSIRRSLDISVYGGIPKIYGEKISPEVLVLKKKFEEKYNKEFDHYVATGYDIVYLIKQVIESSGASREKIREGFENLKKFKGIFGNIEIKDRDFSFPLYPAMVTNDRIIFFP